MVKVAALFTVLSTLALSASAKCLPKPSDAQAKCQTAAKDLQFVVGGVLQPTDIFLDLGQAGQAMATKNPYANQLRKVAGGFTIPLNIAGEYITEKKPSTQVVNSETYKINYQYEVKNGVTFITAVKCHYKEADL
ncbi:hypothetical protein CONCODRAFT_20278 [Conidiobolus coronatus NRRL 28638]|uniref:Uncharacterized protein n=1 Tax=Conidiobolus coronatus (strain ATCC 28846 / CBS 209.66 / NRRL 28638) TaxID=796925 RepID=A0A137NUS2_CONC2|nr:hypothetical protein CONCODRAFT_20278 [Conidiobolus coronatus NRRL 28638]|eukprot:KXN66354.1 hypothetical protein CONCODRAFT_20278 [Conidiobolus coronatus NRRL 28638]